LDFIYEEANPRAYLEIWTKKQAQVSVHFEYNYIRHMWRYGMADAQSGGRGDGGSSAIAGKDNTEMGNFCAAPPQYLRPC